MDKSGRIGEKRGRGIYRVVMSQPAKSRTSCPRCGKKVGLRWSALLPSNRRGRSYKCQACGGLYDLSDNSRIASLLAGMLSMGPGVLLFGRILKAGHGSKPSVIVGTASIALLFGLVSALAGWATLRLEPKN